MLIPPESLAVQLDPIPPPLPGEYPTPLRDPPAIRDPALAIVLGKALFWDMNLGEEGVACATCHHHAGVDGRITHSLPLQKESGFGRLKSELSRLVKAIFPIEPAPTTRPGGSLGISRARYLKSLATCEAPSGSRQRTQRHAPSVINARFSHRLFWDGRARPIFNGRDPWGSVTRVASSAPPQQSNDWDQNIIAYADAALASQALGPLTIPGEMICEGETLSDIARRILPRMALSGQSVHPEDSVLGPYRDPSGLGIAWTYETLIQKVFIPALWKSTDAQTGKRDDQEDTRTPIESNFGVFAGLALMAYEETLISDQTPFDTPRNSEGYPSAYTIEQRRGLDLFNRLECDFCHSGPLFTAAAPPLPQEQRPLKWVDRRVIAPDLAHHSAQVAFLDTGFANIGLIRDGEDPGLGGIDPLGTPLSYSLSYIEQLKDPLHQERNGISVDPSLFSIGYDVDFKPQELFSLNDQRIPLEEIARREGVLKPLHRLGAAVEGAFKVPSLRNVELTGPYMHDGSLETLEAVIDFYDRGGNYETRSKVQTFVHAQHLSIEEKRDLKAFLMTLTDERVRWERAPFDHPELRVVSKTRTPGLGQADQDEIWTVIEAVGANGRTRQQGPIESSR